MKRFAGIRAYPFLMAAYPALAMMAANVDQVEMTVVLRPLLLSLLLCALLYGVLALLIRRPEAAPLLSTWWLLLFFAYGHVYSSLRGVHVIGESLGRHRYLVVVWIVLVVGGAALALRRREWGRTARLLSVASAIAVALPVLRLAVFVVESSLLGAERAGAAISSAGLLPENRVLKAPADGTLPDIYYIILDGYGRSDTLSRDYDYDNTQFIQGLERLGFVVAECSQSNYAQTVLSIASSTNLAYLDELGESFRPGTHDRRPLSPLIQYSAVRIALESLGYRSVAFDTGYAPFNVEDAERYLSPRLGNGLTRFELLFVRSTAGLAVLDSMQVVPRVLAPELNNPDDDTRERVLFTFGELENLAKEPGPKYTYAHIVSPHHPFLLDAEGRPIEDRSAGGGVGKVGYADQARFISWRTLQVLEAILASAEIEPIILLQADHGPSWDSPGERMRILNAYRFPGAEEVIDPSITPVNSFRMMFNAVFGTSFSRLPDVSYFSVPATLYDFTVLPPSCPDEVVP